jgi:hypothetical protein
MIITSNLFGQNIEIFSGLNKNTFHDYNKNKGHFSSSYDSDYGYSVGFGLDSIKNDWLTLRFTLQFDKYKGKLKASDGGLGGGYTTIANVQKSLISVGVFPINFRFFKRLDVNIGLVISRLIDESFYGTSSGWNMNQPNWSYNLHDKYNQYSSNTYFGFQGRIAYDFKLSKSIWISPQYLYYFGLSNEFVEFPEETKAMRHYLCIGLKKDFK